MSESFEAKLMAASSKEVFKKAKQILHADELLCCHESMPGVLRAVFRDSHGIVNRAEFKGFSKGPFTGTCSCGMDYPTFCPHSMAAALYHSKYTIKYKEEVVAADTPAQYAGLKFSGMGELLTQMLSAAGAYVEINAESEFPHVPSKWERVPFTVTLKFGRRDYFGNINNLRQLHFNKNLAAALQLSAFPLQDRQIIRFLALNAQQDGTRLQLDAEQCAEFFHCLAGFQNFRRLGEKVVIHREPATPAILLEKVKEGYILKSAIIVNGAALPLNDVKVVTGRSGCWAGMLGEYWWIPAQTEVSWLRSFLRTTVQPCDSKSAQALLAARDTLPLKIIPASGVKVKQRKFTTLYDAHLLANGTLELELFFNYDGRLCKADQSRLASADTGVFWRRNTKAEFEAVRELLNFGFTQPDTKTSKNASAKFILTEREAIGMFVDEIVPQWLREKRDCLLSSALAALTGDSGAMKISAKLIEKTPTRYIVAISLEAGGVPLKWSDLVSASVKNEFFMTCGAPDLLVKIPIDLKRLASSMSGTAEELTQNDEYPECSIVSIPLAAAVCWAETGGNVPGAVPVEFLKLKLDIESFANDMDALAEPVTGPMFEGELRKYQESGVYWLRAMGERGLNVILADEMGLGKTVQTVALLCASPERNLPAMIVCPTSLVDNWQREASTFAPKLKILKIAGHDRAPLWKKVAAYDVIIVSYALVKRDFEHFSGITFSYLVLDEAQHIKNPSSINAQTCKMIRANHKLVLTGTPLENSADDIWSIFDFLQSGLLGSLSAFRSRYANVSGSSDAGRELSRRIAPFILRRRKADVCTELPEKHEQILYCTMEHEQRALYDAVAREAADKLDRLKHGDRTMTGIDVITSLLRLRQICCDPALMPSDAYPDGIEKTSRSTKMELLQELVMESMDSGHKVLLFSQFTSLLKIVREWLDRENIKYEYLDGSTKDRMERVDAFNKSDDTKLFLLSLKAGGLGLNLTSADTVIIYDPWWNPAAEAQAADRTHRIGQTRNVNCIKLAVRDSIEEKVLALQELKKELFGALVETPGAALGSMSVEDMEFLLETEKNTR